jgi:hypothetical protein
MEMLFVKESGNDVFNNREKYMPARPDKDPDPTKKKSNDPKKNDPTRIEEPKETDPIPIELQPGEFREHNYNWL